MRDNHLQARREKTDEGVQSGDYSLILLIRYSYIGGIFFVKPANWSKTPHLYRLELPFQPSARLVGTWNMQI